MSIHWHRRDLRLRDNRGLSRAAESGPVVPVFVFDPAILEFASSVRVAAMLEALDWLRSAYREHGGDLVIARGDPSTVLPELVSEYDADTVTWNDDYSGLARERDRGVIEALESHGIDTIVLDDALHHEPGSITPNEGEHYSVFSYFWRKWREREKRPPVDPLRSEHLTDRRGDPLPTAGDLGFDEPEATVPTVTPEAGRARLAEFCSDGIYRYEDRREKPAVDGTSRLSVHFKWGTLGPREVYAATEVAIARADDLFDDDDDLFDEDEFERARDSVESFQRQLAWREFYAHVLAFNPDVVDENFIEYDRPIEWRWDPDGLEAWKAGETGYPIVDAGMRQLRAEAWVHNRVRMIVASFLTKDLLIDWREGYDWYRTMLADHDTANDTGGWQWAASTGTDAQPYFRVFNPMTQGERYDPDAAYIKRYVSELAEVPPEEVHQWHELDQETRDVLAPEYPDPIVDHSRRRKEAIDTFERAREN